MIQRKLPFGLTFEAYRYRTHFDLGIAFWKDEIVLSLGTLEVCLQWYK